MAQLNSRFSRALLLIAACALMLFGLPTFQTRADSPIKIDAKPVDGKWRVSYTFTGKASSSAGNIIAARLITKDVAQFETTIYPADKFTPAAEVDLHYTWDVTNLPTPPFMLMYYAWEVTDSAGNVSTSPLTQFELADTSHDWKSLSYENLRVYWYGQDDAYGKLLLDSAKQGYDHVAKATGFTPDKDKEVRVVMYPDQQSFFGFTPSINAIGMEIVGGRTYGALTVQWAETSRPDAKGKEQHFQDFDLLQVVPHELAHAFLFLRMHGRRALMPSWFDEGQAMNNELSGIPDEYNTVKKMIQNNQFFRFSDMINGRATMNSSNQDVVQNWYAESTVMVGYLYDKYGLEVLGKITGLMDKGERFEDALKIATGLTMPDYEKAVREYVGAPALSDSDLQATPTMDMPAFPPTPAPK